MDPIERRLRDAFEAQGKACCVVEVLFDENGRANDYRFLMVNAAFEVHSGLAHSVGKRITELVPDIEEGFFAVYGRVAVTGEPAREVIESKALARWFGLYAARIGDPAAHEVAIFFEDITAHRALEATAKDAQERLEATLRAGSIATWVWDVRADEVYADRNLARLFSVTDAEASGGSLAAYIRAIHPDDRERVGARIEEALASGDSFEAEYRVLAPEGTWRRVVARGRPELDAAGKALRLPGVVVDVTHQRAAEAALQVSEARLAAALKAGRMGTWELDLQTSTLIASDVCKTNYGRTAADSFTYAELAEAVLDEDRAMWRAAVETAIAGAQDLDIEYRTRWPAGGTHWVQVRASCASDASGRVVAMAGVSLLIDQRKRTEEALLAADRQKDEFLATASHELRTPLNAILGWARILRSGRVDPVASRRGLETIERNAQAQVRVIEDILDGSRIVAGKLRLEVRPVDMATLVTAAIETLRPAADAKRIALLVDLEAGVATVSGDPERLQQVVWNLASNALKFTPRGGTVTVRVRRTGMDFELSVHDTGEGIAADFLPHVFDRFRQADGSTTRRQGGLGLGLALVRYLVEAHGGSVRAASDGPGRGAVFTVTLPLDAVFDSDAPPSAPTAGAAAPDAVRPGSLAGVRALVVDDEADARELVSTLLEANGAHVVTASSAEQALDLLARDPPMVLVSDIGMPQVDGYEMIRRLRARRGAEGGTTPAIAVTAYARGEDRRRALDAGFQRHLAKPVEPAELVRLVAELAATRRP